MKTSNEPIRKDKFNQVNQALIATGGKLQSIRDCGNVFRVDYEYVDMDAYVEFCRRRQLINIKISEIRRDSWWRILLRRVHLKRLEKLLT